MIAEKENSLPPLKYKYDIAKSDFHKKREKEYLAHENVDLDNLDYSYITCLTSKKKPDVYMSGEGNTTLVLQSRNYKIMDNKNIISSNNKENLNENISDEENQKAFMEINKFDQRYFTTNNITIKCYNCDEIGHMSKNCPNERIFKCNRCFETGHMVADCPNIKCFKCNQIGHKFFECVKPTNQLHKCPSCNNNGHSAHDCLITPVKIEKKFLKHEDCGFCDETGHIVCKRNNYYVEDYDSDEVYITDSTDYDAKSINGVEKNCSVITKKKKFGINKKKGKQIFNNINNGLIKFTHFCPKCGSDHKMQECEHEFGENSYDKKRGNYRGYETKINYRGYEPKKTVKEFEFYAGDNSSEDSFSNIVKKKRQKKNRNKHAEDIDEEMSDSDIRFNTVHKNGVWDRNRDKGIPKSLEKNNLYDKSNKIGKMDIYTAKKHKRLDKLGGLEVFDKNIGFNNYMTKVRQSFPDANKLPPSTNSKSINDPFKYNPFSDNITTNIKLEGFEDYFVPFSKKAGKNIKKFGGNAESYKEKRKNEKLEKMDFYSNGAQNTERKPSKKKFLNPIHTSNNKSEKNKNFKNQTYNNDSFKQQKFLGKKRKI